MAVAAGTAAASGPPQVQTKRKELTQIQKQLESTRREIEDYRRIEQSLGGELHKLEKGNQEALKKMQQLQRNIRLAESRKSGLKSRLGALGQASGFWRSELESDVNSLAAARASRDDSFGTDELWKESFRRSAIMEKADLMAGLQGISRKTQAEEVQSRRQAADLLVRSRKAEAEQATRKAEYEEKQAAMAEAQQKKQDAIRRVVDLEETAKALNRLIRNLSRNNKRGQPAASKLAIARNSLSWPAAGPVIQSFGRQRNAELNSWVIHQGILLQTAAAAPVYPVRPGRVIFSGPFHSYGQVLIVDHGSGLYGVYGELGAVLKPKGSEVRGGEAMARAGAGGDGKGRLYLELRNGSEALDPALWLESR
ncbi:MAG: peptidoglycan DD-metalloendopeptidase family protein [Elusimicrobia bacterium]|nr:peptidoglycan DD-metalloendopeptidase family protein [Elusimicrobiota bacterium]